MSTTYVYYREIYDINGLYVYIKNTLTTITSVSYNSGTITTYFPSSLSAGDKTTLDGLIISYSNPQVIVNTNNFDQISIGNQSTTPLAGNATFTGFWEDVSDYSSVTVSVYTDVTSISGGLIVQTSSDGTNIDHTYSLNVPSGGYIITRCVRTKYVRIVYINGATAQSAFRLQVIYHYYKSSDYVQLIGRTTNGSLIKNTLAPDGSMEVNLSKSAFGHTIGEQLFPLVQNDYVYQINTETSVTTLTGSGTVTQSGNLAVVSSGAATSSSALLASKKSVKYRPGQGIRGLVTPIFATPAAGNTQICGVGNSDDGLFFGYNGTSFGIMRRYNAVNNWTPQTSWNNDKMDGTGISGQTLNPLIGNVYMIQFQWLGFGMITFHIEETNSGKFHLVHKIAYANTATTTTLLRPYLQMMAQSINTTNATNIAINVICLAAFCEGLPTFNGPKFGVDNNKNLNTNTFVPVLTIKNKTTFNSKTNRISCYMRNLTVSTDARLAVAVIFRNATLTGASYANVNTNNSVMEFDTAATVISGGISMFTFCLGNSTGMNQMFSLYELPLEVGDTYTIAARIPAAAGTNFACAFNWVEDH